MSQFEIAQIQEKRQNVWSGMEAILRTAAAEGRSVLTDAEETDYEARESELGKLDKQLERVQKFNQREAGRNESAEIRGVSRDEMDSAEKRYESAYTQWFRRGASSLSNEQRAVLDSNALSTAPGAPAAGSTGYSAGYLVPQGFWHNLQIALKAYGGLLDIAQVLNTDSGAPMPWPTVDPTGIQGYYLTEMNQAGLGVGQATSGGTAMLDNQFGQGMLSAYTILSGVVLASLQLVEDSAFDVNSFVSDRVGEAIGRKVAQELHTGTGSNAMLGIQTALIAKGAGSVGTGGVYQPASGGSVYVLGNANPQNKLASAAPGWDDIENMMTYVDPAYRKAGNCKWIASDTTYTKLRKLTDNFGHPLWNPDIRDGGFGNIRGYATVIDQNTGEIGAVASTAGGLIFGDFTRSMVVRQVNGAHTMQLRERYADYLQVGYLGFVRMDSRSNDLRSAVLYKTPAS
jgi:HK97 family phage major capsid protein